MDKANFGNNNIEKFKVTIRTGPIPEKGQTLPGHYNSTTGIFSDTIVIKDSLVQFGTQLGVAKTLIHELVHAYLNSILFRANSLSLSQLNAISFDSIFNVYIDTLVAAHQRHGMQNWVNNNPQYDHDFMADRALERMSAALAYIDDNRNTDEYYWDVTWGGIYRSKTFRRYWPNYWLSAPNDWPPANPAPSEDSTWGLKYALTLARLDSLQRYVNYEQQGMPLAKGRPKIPGGCY